MCIGIDIEGVVRIEPLCVRDIFTRFSPEVEIHWEYLARPLPAGVVSMVVHKCQAVLLFKLLTCLRTTGPCTERGGARVLGLGKDQESLCC